MSKRVPPQCDHERMCIELVSQATYEPSKIGPAQITIDYRKLVIPKSSTNCYISSCTPDVLYLIISLLDSREVLCNLSRVCKAFQTIISHMLPEILLRWWKDTMISINKKNKCGEYAFYQPTVKLGILKGDAACEALDKLTQENPPVSEEDKRFKEQLLSFLVSAGAHNKTNPYHNSKGNAFFQTFSVLPYKELLLPFLPGIRCPQFLNYLSVLHNRCKGTNHMQIRDLRVSSSWGGYPPQLAAKMNYFIWDLRKLAKSFKGFLVVYVNENFSVHM